MGDAPKSPPPGSPKSPASKKGSVFGGKGKERALDQVVLNIPVATSTCALNGARTCDCACARVCGREGGVTRKRRASRIYPKTTPSSRGQRDHR